MATPSRRAFTSVAVLSTLIAALGSASARPPRQDAHPDRLWVRQVGRAATDAAFAVHAGRGGAVDVAGTTEGSLGGPNAGGFDAFLSRYTPSGRLLWTRQFGSTARDSAVAVTSDRNGTVYVAGTTFGALAGSNAGEYDAFVAKYDSRGIRVWARQVGSVAGDLASSVAVDALGNVYVAGDSHGDLGGRNLGDADAYLIKFNSAGRRRWARKLATPAGDVVIGTSIDRGRVYVAGQTDGDIGAANAGSGDAFLAAYTTSGQRLWTRQLGTAALDSANGIDTDRRGALYIAGVTHGALNGANAGHGDAFVAKYSSAGSLLWTRQLGTPGDEEANGVSAEGGAVYIAGNTNGDLGGAAAGAGDAFIAKYDTDGNRVWAQLLGTVEADIARSVSADDSGAVYAAGQTAGKLGATAVGFDAFLAKYR